MRGPVYVRNPELRSCHMHSTRPAISLDDRIRVFRLGGLEYKARAGLRCSLLPELALWSLLAVVQSIGKAACKAAVVGEWA